MKWWMVAVGVEICDHGVSFVRVETDDFLLKILKEEADKS